MCAVPSHGIPMDKPVTTRTLPTYYWKQNKNICFFLSFLLEMSNSLKEVTVTVYHLWLKCIVLMSCGLNLNIGIVIIISNILTNSCCLESVCL